MSYLKRYLAGEYAQVWSDLVALGEQVRDPAVFPDAQAVARETMTRVAANVDRIVEVLHTLNYHFYWPDNVRLTPAPDVHLSLDQLESEIGVLPLSLRAWYESVGSVSLSGNFPRYLNDPQYRPPEPREVAPDTKGEIPPLPWPAQGFSPYTDALVVFPFKYFREWQRWPLWHPSPSGEARHIVTNWTKYGDWYENGYIEIAPDFVDKAGYSGGQSYSMQVPDLSADGIILALPTCYWDEPPWRENMWLVYEDKRPVRFVEYLRICCRWGGFPGFAAEYTELPPVLQKLTADLLEF